MASSLAVVSFVRTSRCVIVDGVSMLGISAITGKILYFIKLALNSECMVFVKSSSPIEASTCKLIVTLTHSKCAPFMTISLIRVSLLCRCYIVPVNSRFACFSGRVEEVFNFSLQILKLRRELESAQEKVSALTNQLGTNVSSTPFV